MFYVCVPKQYVVSFCLFYELYINVYLMSSSVTFFTILLLQYVNSYLTKTDWSINTSNREDLEQPELFVVV